MSGISRDRINRFKSRVQIEFRLDTGYEVQGDRCCYFKITSFSQKELSRSLIKRPNSKITRYEGIEPEKREHWCHHTIYCNFSRFCKSSFNIRIHSAGHFDSDSSMQCQLVSFYAPRHLGVHIHCIRAHVFNDLTRYSDLIWRR